jgi:hypothetical protein
LLSKKRGQYAAVVLVIKMSISDFERVAFSFKGRKSNMEAAHN